MKKRISAFAAGMLTAAMLGSLGLGALAAGGYTITVEPINIQVNGQTFQPKDVNGNSVPVFAYNGTTYAPLRALAEAYGLKVGYDEQANMATVGESDTEPVANAKPSQSEDASSEIISVATNKPAYPPTGYDVAALDLNGKRYPRGTTFSANGTMMPYTIMAEGGRKIAGTEVLHLLGIDISDSEFEKVALSDLKYDAYIYKGVYYVSPSYFADYYNLKITADNSDDPVLFISTQ